MKSKVVLTFAITIIFIFFIWLLFLRPQQLVERAYYHRLSTQFEDTITSIDNLLGKENNNTIEYKSYELSYELHKLDTMLEEGSYNFDNRINYIARSHDFSFIAEIITGRRRLKDEFIPLWQDDQLSEGENYFLSALREELNLFAKHLKNEDRNQFNWQINNFFQNWNVEAEVNMNGESYYDYLLFSFD